ncbi:Xanthine/uracil/vitamin C permease (plasmid) [Haloterrigena turkmenica DSM 5511]|uniref:Xanthine/uracil/vitamin C permease n=1 Tax=Haloterrigena turkmenica (strain ATCC 51198 / DSM 5511 / JCM 9101 / NCIMB 13204 / VKM B-1734 / 4k) TaxID=543526 RepID=D2S081_HALTV|nr:NCS2 family permease [Haloterrigena turkmenica]ADB62778.1 Xanthine/uracil/vitamin C permease [Haloterrigena turkmenica DSM 5511]
MIDSPDNQSKVASFFGYEEHGTDTKTEVIAGITTFLTMSYIIVINPAILSEAITIDGYSDGQVFQMIAITTILAAVVGTVVMALYANRPFGLAPGMGLNAYFAFTVVITLGVPWQTALAAVFVEGVIFMAMSSVGARRYIIEFFPKPVKFAVGAGIGLFLLLLGLIEMNVATAHDSTLVTLGNVASDPVALLSLLGLAFTLVLYSRDVTGSIIIGILTTALAGWGLTLAGVVNDGLLTPGSVPDPHFDITPLVGAFIQGFQNIEPVTFAIVVFTFFFVDFFDTAGTLIGVSQFGGFLDDDGNLPEMEKPLMADAVATTFGAIIGTTTVTTYVESSTGIEEGGRTGMTALVVSLLFLLSLAVIPIVAAIPTYASYLALVVVGLIMLEGITEVNWEETDWLIPGGLTMVMMPLTASIATGIAAGIISYPIVKTAQGEYGDIHLAQWILAGAFVLYFYVTSGGVI